MRVDSIARRAPDRGVPGRRLHGAPLRQPGVGWASDISRPSRPPKPTAFHKKYYVPVEHRHRSRRRLQDLRPRCRCSRRTSGRIPTGPPPQRMTHRRAEADRRARRGACTRRRSRSISRATTSPTTARPTTRSTRRSPTSFPTAARRASTARSFATSASPLVAEGFSGFPGVEVSGPLRLLRRPHAGPHGRGDGTRRFTKSSTSMKTTDVTDAELERFKSRARADLLRSLGDNAGPRHDARRLPDRATATGARCSASCRRSTP